MDTFDSEKIDAGLESERARLVAALRRIADRLETLPAGKVSEALAMLAGWIETLERRAERVLRCGYPDDRA